VLGGWLKSFIGHACLYVGDGGSNVSLIAQYKGERSRADRRPQNRISKVKCYNRLLFFRSFDETRCHS
jgi:hypothetical protein